MTVPLCPNEHATKTWCAMCGAEELERRTHSPALIRVKHFWGELELQLQLGRRPSQKSKIDIMQRGDKV